MKFIELKSRTHRIINTHRKPFAIITGASSGIGHSFAVKFAREGYDLLLIARDSQRLNQIEYNLNKNYNTKVYTLSVDLTQRESLNKIEKFLKEESLDVDVLINNAGFGVHGAFQETEINRELEMVDLQISTTLALTKMILPGMQKRKSGYILNVGSVYSFTPVPFQSVYGGCKSFLYSFSSSLAYETKKYGIKVMLLCPGITKTEFRSRSKVGYYSENLNKLSKLKQKGMDPDFVAEQGYKALMRGDKIYIPGLTNRIFVQIASCLPTSFLSSALALINNFRGVNTKNA
ncbi:SDR family NAD(P)-dependent oxidoreductase [Fluviispira multicolorata]|uniref:SDR family NAD(P)-dependent oxidoreductase n=1 Tax=Fluviispira multicolorata TaxID=2654512 RepID=A0A833JDS9_9BACT|nr:SDR family oxidoreductase [Fluviispira multicolorata]KAB8029085.1 SDR family NAD(P)-dependent oxidoreductase [Fluviispira multicolorata]